MNGNSEGKASAGQPFKPPKAEIWNSMIDAGNSFRNGQLSNGVPDRTRPRNTDIISVKNDCGEDRARGEILSFTDKAVTDLTDEHIWLLGSEVTVCDYFGILKEPIADGSIGPIQVSGCCMAQVDIVDADHTCARAIAGSYVLESATTGPIEILYKPSGTGELECVVRFGGASKMRLGRTGSGGLSISVAGTITLYDEVSGGYTIGSETIEAWAFPTAIVGIADVAIWEVGCRNVAFKVC
jgi:hypothetical protein